MPSACFLALAIFSLAASPVSAATYSWLGSVNTDWANGGNWIGGGVPTGTDVATWPAPGYANSAALSPRWSSATALWDFGTGNMTPIERTASAASR